jgi:serine protease
MTLCILRQWNLSKIQADLAWNLSQGCTNVKVAVTDDGFLLTHEDLVNQWHINSGEIAGNGIDDDANGYIDDWRGWDAANNDNDPSATSPTNSYFTHGTHVAGIIAGQTNNSKGIASIGYNCKMIPIKLGLSSNSSLTGAFQGLDYASQCQWMRCHQYELGRRWMVCDLSDIIQYS